MAQRKMIKNRLRISVGIAALQVLLLTSSPAQTKTESIRSGEGARAAKLQELVNNAAQWLRIPQLTIPVALHDRLIALKYLVFLDLSSSRSSPGTWP